MQLTRRRVIVRSAAVVAAVAVAWWGVGAVEEAGWFDASAVPVADDVARAMLWNVTRWDAATSGERRGVAERVERSLAAESAGFALLRVRPFGFEGHRHEMAVFLHEATGLEFSLIPGGTFTMGSPETEADRLDDETQHEVTLTRPFLLARTECTQAVYERVAGANPSVFPGADRPVENRMWDDATAFCAKAGLRLPTEAEWEFACRAGTTTAYWSGDAEGDLDRVDWYGGNSGPTIVAQAWAWVTRRAPPSGEHGAVARLPANPFGLYDVHGNVSEWCSDRYAPYPVGWMTDPTGPSTEGSGRVFRGGSWSGAAGRARSAQRFGFGPYCQYDYLGFRPARSVTP